MLSRDLIASVIKTFFEELDDVRDGGKRTGSAPTYAAFYPTYFNRDRDWFIGASLPEITDLFAGDPVYKLEMLAELLYREAQELAEATLQKRLYRKIIDLYEVIDIQSREFSIERMNRIAELKQKTE